MPMTPHINEGQIFLVCGVKGNTFLMIQYPESLFSYNITISIYFPKLISWYLLRGDPHEYAPSFIDRLR